MISAILGTREGATEAGHALTSTGVTWTDPVDAAALHEALATRKIENVMLVSAFMAAAALAQTVGNTVGDHHTALLFLERDTATLAVVDSADGAISDVHKELIPGDSVAELAGMLAGLDELETQPQSVFIVGTGVDVAAIKPQLETLTALPVTAAEEPETALAWGAALASANAPLFASSTAALAYAQDPGTGAVDPFAVSPGYLAAPDVPFGTELGEEDLAYSAVPDEEAEVHTVAQDVITEEHLDHEPERRPLVLVGSILAVVFVAAALSLEVALALGIRPSVALLPRPLQNLIIQAPAPAAAPANVQVPEANHLIAPAIAPAPAHAPIPAPRPAAPALVPAAPPIPVCGSADTRRGSCAGGCSAANSGACAGAGPRSSAARAGPRPVSAGARSPAAASAPPVAAATGRRTGTASDSFADPAADPAPGPGRPGPAGEHAGSVGGTARSRGRRSGHAGPVGQSAWRVRRWEPRLWRGSGWFGGAARWVRWREPGLRWSPAVGGGNPGGVGGGPGGFGGPPAALAVAPAGSVVAWLWRGPGWICGGPVIIWRGPWRLRRWWSRLRRRRFWWAVGLAGADSFGGGGHSFGGGGHH